MPLLMKGPISFTFLSHYLPYLLSMKPQMQFQIYAWWSNQLFRSTYRMNNQCNNQKKSVSATLHFFCLAIAKGGLYSIMFRSSSDIFEKWKCVRPINSWLGWRNLMELDILIKTVRLLVAKEEVHARRHQRDLSKKRRRWCSFFRHFVIKPMTLSQMDDVVHWEWPTSTFVWILIRGAHF